MGNTRSNVRQQSTLAGVRPVCDPLLVELFEEIADERRVLAATMAGLTTEQQRAPSLCAQWSVHDVVAHLVVPLEVGMLRFAAAMLAARGSFDRANDQLTRRQARVPFDELVGVLDSKAASRFTPPGAGPEAPLTDLLVHGLDVRWPLGLPRDVPPDRLRTSLTFLTTPGAGHVVASGTLTGLRLEAADLGWTHGSGPLVSGSAEALLLAVAGRPAALDHLDGDGVPTLRDRLT